MRLPASYDVRFEGFTREAFEILDRLRADPTIACYRREKEGVARHIVRPFRRFRDDLVVNVVIPNQLELETERNVFSRLLKNDFGAGGCHSHVWMAFYRPGRTRLTDYQPFHGIEPDGFYVGLHVGGRDRRLIAAARRCIQDAPRYFLDEFNKLLSKKGWTLEVCVGTGRSRKTKTFIHSLAQVPNEMMRADAWSVYLAIPRDQVIGRKERLVEEAAAATAAIWPFYQAFAGGQSPDA